MVRESKITFSIPVGEVPLITVNAGTKQIVNHKPKSGNKSIVDITITEQIPE